MSMTIFELYSNEVPPHVFVVGNEDSETYREYIEETVKTIFAIPAPEFRSPCDALTMNKVKEYFHVCELLGHIDTGCLDFWGTLVLEDFGLPAEGHEPRGDVFTNRVRVVFRFIRGYRDGSPTTGESNKPPVIGVRNVRLQDHEAGVLLGQGDLRRIL